MADLAPSATATDADILLQAEAIVRGYCGWHISPPESRTVTLEHDDSCELVLPSQFVTSVTSVSYEGTDVTGWRLTAAGVLKNLYVGCGPVEVEFTSGYAADAVPPAVTRVVQAIAQRITANPGAKSVRIGPFSESSDTGLLADEMLALGPFVESPV